MKRLVRSFGFLVLSGVLGAYGSSHVLAAAAGQAAAVGSLSGTASSSTGQVVTNTVVQLRNLATGQLAGSTTSNVAGQFSFIGLNPGNYAVEVVNAAGQIVGTSASVAVSCGRRRYRRQRDRVCRCRGNCGRGRWCWCCGGRRGRCEHSCHRRRGRGCGRCRGSGCHERERKSFAIVRSRSARAALVAALEFHFFPFPP